MDGALERVGICEGLVGEKMSFEIVPDKLDVVELGGVCFDHLHFGAHDALAPLPTIRHTHT